MAVYPSRSVVRSRVTVLGSMARTLTATMVPSSANTWVMPTLRPINPILIAPDPSAAPEQGRRAQGARQHAHERTVRCVSECAERAARRSAAWSGGASHLDLDVDTGGQRKPPKGIDRLCGRVEDVDQSLVGADLELLARVLVDERGAQDRE